MSALANLRLFGKQGFRALLGHLVAMAEAELKQPPTPAVAALLARSAVELERVHQWMSGMSAEFAARGLGSLSDVAASMEGPMADVLAELREQGHRHGIIGKARATLSGWLEESGSTRAPYYPVSEVLLSTVKVAFDQYWKSEIEAESFPKVT